MKNGLKAGRNIRTTLLHFGVAATVGAAVSMASVAAHAQGAASQADWAQVEEAALKEGTISFYHNLNPAGSELLANAFRKAHPDLNLEMTRLGSAPLIQRFDAEFGSGRHLVDVVITMPDASLLAGMDKGWMAAWTPPNLDAYPERVNYQGKNMMFNVQTAREAIVWNTRRVSDEEAPREWADLTDPKWKGRIGMNPPWRSLTVQAIVAYWDELGLGDMATKMKDNDVRFFEGSGGVLQAVIRGDVHVANLTDLPLNAALADGAPIGFVYPESGTTLSEGYVFVAEHAPHPNAARVFVNWLLSEEGQTLLQTYAGLSATRPGIPPLSHIPATSELSNTRDGLELIPPEKQKEIVSHWRTVFGVQ